MTEEMAPKLRLVQVFLSSATFKHQGDPLSRAPNTPQGPQQCSIRITFADLSDGATIRVTLGVATKPMESALYEFDVEMVALIEKSDDVARALSQRDLVEIGA